MKKKEKCFFDILHAFFIHLGKKNENIKIKNNSVNKRF